MKAINRQKNLPHQALCAGLLSLALAFSAGDANAQKTIKQHSKAQKLDYLLFLPKDYSEDTQNQSPLLLFLHGGDRSNTKHNPQKYAAAADIDFPFIVVSPHCTSGCSWSTVDFHALLKEVIAEYNVDQTRIYLTGYSMGGYGSWNLLVRSPSWFAAAAPIAGGGDASKICKAKNITVRAYHGDKDNVISHRKSESMINALKECGGSAELILYPGVDHGSWPRTFSDPEFYKWLLKHKKVRDN